MGGKKTKKQADVGSGSKKRLTSVLIFHADVRSENVLGDFF